MLDLLGTLWAVLHADGQVPASSSNVGRGSGVQYRLWTSGEPRCLVQRPRALTEHRGPPQQSAQITPLLACDTLRGLTFPGLLLCIIHCPEPLVCTTQAPYLLYAVDIILFLIDEAQRGSVTSSRLQSWEGNPQSPLNLEFLTTPQCQRVNEWQDSSAHLQKRVSLFLLISRERRGGWLVLAAMRREELALSGGNQGGKAERSDKSSESFLFVSWF